MSRRDAITFLMTGGYLLAGSGGAIAAAVGILVKLRPSAAPADLTAGRSSMPSASLATNKALAFRNPRNQRRSILIHLPSGAFVAYDQRCTHVGVLVNYDPATHHLICPAHGAVFDPAQQGKVLQGPATQSLAQITVHIQTDGSMTFG